MDKPRVWVVGDCILDHHRYVRYSRPSPEDPDCPVCVDEREKWELGGAANVARWIAGLSDVGGVNLYAHWPRRAAHTPRLFECLDQAGVHLSTYFDDDSGRGTVKERVYVEEEGRPSRQVVRIDEDTNVALTELEAVGLTEYWRGVLNYHPVPAALVVADYRKGVFTGGAGQSLIANLTAFADEFQIPLIVNSKRPQLWDFCAADFLVCNRYERAPATHVLAARCEIVTLAECGVYAKVAGGPYVEQETLLPTLPVDVTGAGDAFLAGLTVHLVGSGFRRGDVLTEERLRSSLVDAQLAAAHCCTQTGCGTPGRIADDAE